MPTENKNKYDGFNYPMLTKAEFKFIRNQCGITLKRFAELTGKSSRSTIWNWEWYDERRHPEKYMKPYQVKLLMEVVPPELFEDCRRLYKMEEAN